MDFDQEKFYEDEDQEVRAEAQQPDIMEDIDDMKYFLELLKHIRAAIRAGANVPLTNKKIIDAEKCLMIINEMDRNLPDAVQYGMQMYSERDRILGNAETYSSQSAYHLFADNKLPLYILQFYDWFFHKE